MSTTEPILGLVLPDPGVLGVAGSGDPVDGNVLNANWIKLAKRAGGLVHKLVEVDHNNSVAVSDDNQLLLPLPYVGNWAYHGVLYFRSTAASGFKLSLEGDGVGLTNANLRWSYTGFALSPMLFGTAGGQSIAVADTGFKVLEIRGRADTSTAAAVLKVRWAQVTSGAGPTTILQGSYLHSMMA